MKDDNLQTIYMALRERVLALRDERTGVWTGELSSSALGTALALTALGDGGAAAAVPAGAAAAAALSVLSPAGGELRTACFDCGWAVPAYLRGACTRQGGVGTLARVFAFAAAGCVAAVARRLSGCDPSDRVCVFDVTACRLWRAFCGAEGPGVSAAGRAAGWELGNRLQSAHMGDLTGRVCCVEA